MTASGWDRPRSPGCGLGPALDGLVGATVREPLVAAAPSRRRARHLTRHRLAPVRWRERRLARPPGSMLRADRSASSCVSGQCPAGPPRRPRCGPCLLAAARMPHGPRGARASLASDSAVDRALAEAAGARLAKSSSRAISRPSRCARANHDQFAKALGGRAVPGASAALVKLYGERAEKGHSYPVDSQTLRFPQPLRRPRAHYLTPRPAPTRGKDSVFHRARSVPIRGPRPGRKGSGKTCHIRIVHGCQAQPGSIGSGGVRRSRSRRWPRPRTAVSV